MSHDNVPGLESLAGEQIRVRFTVISDGDNKLNQLLQCLQHPDSVTVPLRLQDRDTNVIFDIEVTRIQGTESDPLMPHHVIFNGLTANGEKVMVLIDITHKPEGTPLGFATLTPS